MGVQSQNWFMDILRQIFGFFDELVYGLFGAVIQGIFDISDLATNSSVFSGLYTRLYVILGVFMAFKLAFSFFQYLVNPDQMVDKSKGVGKLFSRVFIMLFALMFLPPLLFSGFGTGGGALIPRAQKAFLPVLPKVILGTDKVGDSVEETVDYTTKSIIKSTLRTFFHPAEGLDDACDTGTFAKLTEIENTDDFRAKIIDSCTVTKGEGQRKFLWIFNVAKVYTYTYIPIISTVVGVLLLLLLVAISIDLAKRCFKLVILEVIAPIPIMSLIDPAASKGESAFSKWSKNLLSTFIDIFIKVGIVYLVLVFLDLITTTINNGTELFSGMPEDSTRKGYLIVLLIIGLIYFAKEAPKFIKESLGMKADKGGLFDDVKSIAKTAGIVGGIGLGATAGAARALGGNIGAAGTAFRNGHGLAGVAALLNPASALKGAIEGGQAGKKGAGKHGNIFGALAGGWSSQAAGNAQRRAYAEEGSTAFGRARAQARNAFTGTTAGGWDQARIEANDAIGKEFSSFDEFLGKKAAKEQLQQIDSTGGVHHFSYGELQAAIAAGDNAWAQSHGFESITAAAQAEKTSLGKQAKRERYKKYKNLTQEQVQQAIASSDFSSLTAYGITDAASAQDLLEDLQSNQESFAVREESYNQALERGKLDRVDNYGDAKSRSDQAANNSIEIRNRRGYRTRKANADSVKNKKKK